MSIARVGTNRFWSKVAIAGEEDYWLWLACVNGQGYGGFAVGRRAQKAHRVAWVLSGNDIASTDCILHSCDNPPCCNPKHMHLGTRTDNNRERRDRGRSRPRRGEQNGVTELSDEQVMDLRRRRAAGEGRISLAASFGISSGNVSKIASGRTWKHLPVMGRPERKTIEAQGVEHGEKR